MEKEYNIELDMVEAFVLVCYRNKLSMVEVSNNTGIPVKMLFKLIERKGKVQKGYQTILKEWLEIYLQEG